MNVQADYNRFLDQHSWYKHIPLAGDTFVVCKGIGQQPRNGVHPGVTDASGTHLYFFDKQFFNMFKNDMKNIDVTKYAEFQTGPFMTTRKQKPHGFHIIYGKATPERFESWLRSNYPQLQSVYDAWLAEDMPCDHELINALYEAENAKYLHNFQIAFASVFPSDIFVEKIE